MAMTTPGYEKLCVNSKKLQTEALKSFLPNSHQTCTTRNKRLKYNVIVGQLEKLTDVP